MSFFGWIFTIILIAAVVYLWKEQHDLKSEVMKFRYLERSITETRQNLEQELTVTRRHLAQVSEGSAPPREAIVDGMPYTDLQPDAAKELVESKADVVILDVRSVSEYNAGHIKGAKNVPINVLEQQIDKLDDKEKPHLVYCASGGRSSAALELLARKGFGSLYHLPTGFPSWPGERDEVKAE